MDFGIWVLMFSELYTAKELILILAKTKCFSKIQAVHFKLSVDYHSASICSHSFPHI